MSIILRAIIASNIIEVMITSRNSNVINFNALVINYSTLMGSAVVVSSSINVSSISTNNINISTLQFITQTYSTINTSILNASTILCSTIVQPYINISTLQVSTIGVGSSFLATNGSNTGTISSLPQYSLDVSGTIRASALQYHDNTATVSEQNVLNYNGFGQTWVQSIAPSAAWRSIAMSANGQYQVACVNGGALWYSSTYGKSWLASTTSGTTAVAWSAIACSGSGQYVVASITSGAIWYSSTYGQTWTVSSASSLAWSSIAISASGQNAVACVTTGALWYSSNFGQSWTASTTSGTTTLAWTCIAISASGQYVVACVNAGSLWYSSTYGQTWTASTTSGTTAVAWTSIAISASGQYAVASINTGAIWYSTNFGQTWTVSSSSSLAWTSVAISASGQYSVACVNAAAIWYSTNFGNTWTAVTDTTLQKNWQRIALSSTGQYITAAINSGVIYTSYTPTNTLAVSNNVQVTENVNTNMIIYSDASVAQSSSAATLDYTTFGQTWTKPPINKTIASTPIVELSGTGQYQAVSTAPVLSSPLANMSGLQLWLDAADPYGTGVTPGAGTISSWIDKSGNGRNATITGTFTIIPNTMNGLPVVSITNIGPISATNYGSVPFPANLLANYLNILYVYKKQGSDPPLTYFTPVTCTYDGFGNPLDQYGATRVFSSGQYVDTAFNLGGTNNTVLMTQLMTTSGTQNFKEFVNGSATASADVNRTTTATLPTTFCIATRNSDKLTSFNGYICEIIVYNSAMSSANRSFLEGYLAWKWGIQGNLPVGHAYYSFNPLNPTVSPPYSILPGLQLWLDASTLNIANGAVVTSWRTSGGTPYTFTSSNATYRTNTQNGLGVVSFAAGQSGTVANFVLAQTQTIFMVTYAVDQGTSSLFLEQGPNENSNPGFYLWSGGGQNYALNTGTGQIAVNTGNVTTQNVWQIIGGMNPDPANSNQMAFYVNGALSATGATQSGNTTITNTLNFNPQGRGVNNTSYLAEVLIYNVALTAVQRQQVEGYLAWKWGIQSVLAGGNISKGVNPSTTLISTNYGQSWIAATISSKIWTLAFSLSGQYQAGCISGGGLWYSSTYGQSWTISATAGTSALAWSFITMSASGKFAMACVNGGAIWYSSNYGQTWTTSDSGSYAWTSIATSASGQYQYACHSTSSGGVFMSVTYGQSWVLLPSTTFGTNATICSSASGQYVTVCSISGGINYSANYGQTWAAASSTTGPTWFSIQCTASGQYQLATNSATSGSVYYSVNYGQTWTIVSNTTYKCGNASLSQNGEYALLASATNVYQSVTRLGSVSLQTITYPSSSYIIGSPLYLTLPGGIIIQTGTFTMTQVANTRVTQAVVFPKAFPNNTTSVILGLSDTGAGYGNTYNFIMPQLITTTGFLCVMKYVRVSLQYSNFLLTIYWQAVGY